MESAENCIFFCGERKNNRHFLYRTLFIPRKNLSAIKAEQLVDGMMSHIMIRNCRCCCIVLNSRHQIIVMMEKTIFMRNWVGIQLFPCIKGKAVPLQVWTGPEGSRKLRVPDFVTTAQDGGRLPALRTGRFLPPGNTPVTQLC